MFKRIKKFFNKTVSITILVIMALFCIIFSDWILLQVDHTVAYYHVYQGDRQYKKHKLQKAINNYNKALELYPEHVKARYNLGNIYAAYEDFGSAVNCYETALKHDPDHINARINLGIVLSEELLDHDRAIEEYEQVIQAKTFPIDIPFIFNNSEYIISGKAIALYNMGLAYRAKSILEGSSGIAARNFLKKAAESYEKSLKIIPDSYDTVYNLALTYHLMKKYTQALEKYCAAVNIAPLNYEAHYNLALLLKTMKKYDEAVTELEKAGLILNSKGDGYKSRYVFDILSDVRSKANVRRNYQHLVEKIDTAPIGIDQITYLDGKVVISKQLDNAIINNMKTCNSCSLIKSIEK